MESSTYEVKNLWAMADMVTRDRRARWVPTIYNQRFDYGRRSQGIDHREYGPRQREDHRCRSHGSGGLPFAGARIHDDQSLANVCHSRIFDCKWWEPTAHGDPALPYPPWPTS